MFYKNSISEDDKYFYKLNVVNSEEILMYHHLGLGDVIICNGFINYLSIKENKKINLIIDKKFLNSIQYLYSENKNVELFPVSLSDVNNAENEVEKVSNQLNMKALKVGFSYFEGMRFYEAFYKQIELPYKYSYKYFYQPRDLKKEELLCKSLINFYKVKEEFKLVHSEASNRVYDLQIEGDDSLVYVEKDSDIFSNIFYYNTVIEKAKEVHCLNSSFCHFVDRVNSKSKLYYHDIRGSRLKLKSKWRVINYGN